MFTGPGEPHCSGIIELTLMAMSAGVVSFALRMVQEIILRIVSRMRSAQGLCSRCAYDRRNSLSGMCPECGAKQ